MQESAADNFLIIKSSKFSAISPILILLFFGILVFWLYSNTLESPFIFDSVPGIEENPDIRITQFSLREIVNAGFKGSKTRPVAYISFALNYYFHQYRPWGYHVVNIIIHILSGFFLYLFINTTIKVSSSQSKFAQPGLIAFLAALIWLIHPLQTQSVTYIVQRMNSMAALLFILSLWLYVKGRCVRADKKKWPWYIASVIAWLVSLGCKQITLTLPVFIFLYEWYFFQDLSKDWFKRSLKYAGGIVFLFVFIALIYTDFDPWVKLGNFRDFANKEFTVAERALTQLRVCIYYISLIFFPLPSRLNLDYDFPLSYSLINPISTLLSLGIIIGLIVLAGFLARKERLISYCLLWFFGNLVIESSIIPLAIIFEHRLYLPSMLVFLIPVILAYRYIKIDWLKVGVLGAVVIVFSVWTHQRNRMWESDLTLWTDCVKKSPNKARPRLNLGESLSKSGRVEEAIEQYTEALRINPRYAKAHFNLGNAMVKQGKPAEAVKHYSDALQLESDLVAAHINLGKLLAEQGKIEEAINHFLTALKLKPNFPQALLNLGVALAKQGNTVQAITHFNHALQLDPDYADAYYNLAIGLEEQGRTDEAISQYLAAVEKNPDYAEAYYNLGNILLKQGKTDAAIRHYQKALSIMPDYTQALSNLALAYVQQKEYASAVIVFQKLVELWPDNAEIHYNIACMYSRLNQIDESTQWLRKAVKKGYRNWDNIKTDHDLDNIRSASAYQELVKGH